jgi:hypothetical protein
MEYIQPKPRLQRDGSLKSRDLSLSVTCFCSSHEVHILHLEHVTKVQERRLLAVCIVEQ